MSFGLRGRCWVGEAAGAVSWSPRICAAGTAAWRLVISVFLVGCAVARAGRVHEPFARDAKLAAGRDDGRPGGALGQASAPSSRCLRHLGHTSGVYRSMSASPRLVLAVAGESHQVRDRQIAADLVHADLCRRPATRYRAHAHPPGALPEVIPSSFKIVLLSLAS